MKIEDLVILGTGGAGHRAAVVQVFSEYVWKPTPEPEPLGDYQHQRAATMIAVDPDALWRAAGAGAAEGHNKRWTLLRCPRPIDGVTMKELIASRSHSA